jgi:hypothetical protein
MDSIGDSVVSGELDESVVLLRQTRPWVRLVGILMTVGAVLLVIVGRILATGLMPGVGVGEGVAMFVLYGLVAILYFAPARFLLRYASSISEFENTPTVARMNVALKAQKSFWKFVGIMMVIVLGFYAILLVFAVLLGAMS